MIQHHIERFDIWPNVHFRCLKNKYERSDFEQYVDFLKLISIILSLITEIFAMVSNIKNTTNIFLTAAISVTKREKQTVTIAMVSQYRDTLVHGRGTYLGNRC